MLMQVFNLHVLVAAVGDHRRSDSTVSRRKHLIVSSAFFNLAVDINLAFDTRVVTSLYSISGLI